MVKIRLLPEPALLILQFEEKTQLMIDNIMMHVPHELRTPLVSIIGYPDLLANDLENLSREEIRDIVRSVPLDGFKIKADVSGISETERLSRALDTLKDTTVTVTTKHVSLGSSAKGYSEGGKLPGYGGGDQHPALLESGEWVINKQAVSKYGSSLFDSLNSMRLPTNSPMRLASGGQVSSGKSNSGSVNVNFILPGSGRTVPAQMSSLDADELIGQLKVLDRLSS